MKFLVFLLIALAWAFWVVAWGRDRRTSSVAFGRAAHIVPSTAWGPPRSVAMARRRRREVLAALVTAAIFSLALAQLWSPMWLVHVLADVVAVAFAAAVVRIERPDVVESLRSSVRPVVVDDGDLSGSTDLGDGEEPFAFRETEIFDPTHQRHVRQIA